MIDERLAEFFAAAPAGIVAVYVFGSAARGERREPSDVDVGVVFAHRPPPTLTGQPYALEGALEQRLGCEVDLVALNDAPVDLRIRVLREGRLVFEGARAARIRFEVKTRNEAFDLEPTLRRYRAPRPVSA